MLLDVVRTRFTWNFMIANFKTKEAYSLYIQFSLTDPWWLPRYEPHLGEIDISLYGWLFFYFGRRTEGILYETTDENAKIIDKKGFKYRLFTAKDRKMRDKIRKEVKNKSIFDIEETINEDGTKHLTLIVYHNKPLDSICDRKDI